MQNRKAFYIPRDFFGHAISFWTGIFCWGSKSCSHEEIGIYIDKELLELIKLMDIKDKTRTIPNAVGWWYYSSTTRNRTTGQKKSNGTRWISEKNLFKYPERWRIYEGKRFRPIKDMVEDANYLLGCPYDWWGIGGFLTISGQLNSKKEWYCSEICQRLYSGKWVKRVSPRQEEKYTRKVLKWKEVKI